MEKKEISCWQFVVRITIEMVLPLSHYIIELSVKLRSIHESLIPYNMFRVFYLTFPHVSPIIVLLPDNVILKVSWHFERVLRIFQSSRNRRKVTKSWKKNEEKINGMKSTRKCSLAQFFLVESWDPFQQFSNETTTPNNILLFNFQLRVSSHF